MDGKLQAYRLEKRKGEVDDASIIAGKVTEESGRAAVAARR